MGVKKRSRNVYYQISNGKVRRRVKNATGETETREVEIPGTNDTVVKHELVYDLIEGYITAVFVNTTNKYNDTLEITVEDSTDTFIVTCVWPGPYAKRIVQRLPNVDFHKPVEIIPYDFKNADNKQYVGANVFQESIKIPSFYIEVDGEGKFLGWKHGYPFYDTELIGDDKDEKKLYNLQLSKFLKQEIADRVIPLLHVANVEKGKHEPVQNADIDDPLLEDGEDDLPF